MNDYKEMIVKCEEWLEITKRLKADDLTQHIEMCADAIEQLVKERDERMEYAKQERKRSIERYHELAVELDRVKKERDAAVADLKEISDCGYCKWFRDLGIKVGCVCQEPCNNISGVNTMWEWRGVKEDNDEID